MWDDINKASRTYCTADSNLATAWLSLDVTLSYKNHRCLAMAFAPCAKKKSLHAVGNGTFLRKEKKNKIFFFSFLFFIFHSLAELDRPLAVCTPSLNVSPFLSSLWKKFSPLHIYNSLQDCSSTPGCQTIQMRHQRSPFSGTLQATTFTVQSQRLAALGRLVGP